MQIIRAWPLQQTPIDYIGAQIEGNPLCDPEGADDPFTRLSMCGSAGFGERGGAKCAVLNGGFMRTRRGDLQGVDEWTIVFDVWHDRDTPANLGQYGSGREVYVSLRDLGSGQGYLFRDEYDGHIGLHSNPPGHRAVQAGTPPWGEPISAGQWHRFGFGRNQDGYFVAQNGQIIFEGQAVGNNSSVGVRPGFGAEWRAGQAGQELISYPLVGGMRNIMLIAQALTPADLEALQMPTLPIIGNNATTTVGHAVDEVVIWSASTRELIARINPEASGDWSTFMRYGQSYDLTYFAEGCAPICHGTYTTPASEGDAG